jgi:hypothetical protein
MHFHASATAASRAGAHAVDEVERSGAPALGRHCLVIAVGQVERPPPPRRQGDLGGDILP